MASSFCSSCALRTAMLALALVITTRGQPGAGLHSPVNLIQADPHHNGTLLAGTATARLFRSRDGGDTWSPLTFPAELRSTLHAILIDPDRPNVYWVAVSSELAQFAGVFCSVDEGVTWHSVAALERKRASDARAESFSGGISLMPARTLLPSVAGKPRKSALTIATRVLSCSRTSARTFNSPSLRVTLCYGPKDC